MSYFLLAIGFILLVKGADLLVSGASEIADRLKISHRVIGLTIVALGTSMPELFVNVISSVRGDTGIAIGNILGSNIANVCLICGICSLIRPLTIHRNTVWKEIPFVLLAAIVLGFLAHGQFPVLSRTDGLILLSFFFAFMYYTFSISIAKKPEKKEDETYIFKHRSWMVSVFFICAGLAGLSLGGKWIVDGAVDIAQNFGLSKSLVGLTIVAVGTALPELATSVAAVRRGNFGIAVGNIVGSNVFNIFFVLGISALIRSIPLQKINNIDIGMLILSSFLLFLFMFTGKKHSLDRWEGILLLVLYTGYLFFLFFIQ